MTDLSSLPRERLEDMVTAAAEIEECYRVLKKTSANIVGQVIANQGTFYEWNHYPDGDVYDSETHAQYYYHNHPREDGSVMDEHGHFHLFLRSKGIPKGIKPAPYSGDWKRPMGDDALSHIIGISMNQAGSPIALFTANRWVTGETFYRAEDVIQMLDHFAIDHTWPCWAANRWMAAMVRLFQPDICKLLMARDESIEAHQTSHPKLDVYEDRSLEITGAMTVSTERRTRELRELLH